MFKYVRQIIEGMNYPLFTFNKYVVLSLLFCALAIPSYSYDFIVDGIAYVITSDSTAAVTNSSRGVYDSTNDSYDFCDNYAWATNISIPMWVNHEGVEYTITEIGPNAFKGCVGINEISLPNSIKTIGTDAFPRAITINIPNSVIDCGNNTISAGELYWDCISEDYSQSVSLGYVGHFNIGHNVISIPYLFKLGIEHGSDLTTLFIPQNVKQIANRAFYGTSLLRLIVEDGTGLVVGNELAFGKNLNTTFCIKGEARDFKLTNNYANVKNYLLAGRNVTSMDLRWRYSNSTYYCYASTPPVLLNPLQSNYQHTMYIPKESAEAYFTDENWTSSFSLINELDVPEKVEISPKNKTLDIGETFTFSLSSLVEPYYFNDAVRTTSWSTNPQIVKKDGFTVTAMAPGEADIITLCVDRFDTCHVVVREPESLILDKNSIGVCSSLTETIKVTTTPTAAKECLYVQSCNTNIASVKIGNDHKSIEISGISPGQTDAYVKCGNKVELIHIIVMDTPPNYITLTQTEVTINQYNQIIVGISSTEPVDGYTVTNNNPTIAYAQLTKSDDNNYLRITALSPGKASVTVGSTDGTAVEATCYINVPGVVKGDVNCDGEVNTGDVSAIYGIILGTKPDNGRADLSGDSEVNVADVSALYGIILGLGVE